MAGFYSCHITLTSALHVKKNFWKIVGNYLLLSQHRQIFQNSLLKTSLWQLFLTDAHAISIEIVLHSVIGLNWHKPWKQILTENKNVRHSSEFIVRRCVTICFNKELLSKMSQKNWVGVLFSWQKFRNE